jgi:undecaprenyl-diphosphatase
MLALLFRDWRMSIALFFWCTTTTFTRLYLGVHYLGDVTVGAIVGIIMGTLFYFIYAFIRQRTSKVNSTISEQYTSSGYLRSDINNFLLLIVANYIVLIIIATAKGI